MDVSKRIKYFRESKGYSINKLANLAGVSQSYLRDIELGNKNPTIAFLSLLCDQLGITLTEFFCEHEDTDDVNEQLLQKIQKLTPEQRKGLLDFLDTL